MPTPVTGRRPELTFADNAHHGRHGWLRLTPAYSVRVVRALLDEAPQEARILDPFSGSGTTPLCAAERGMRAFGLELNPFLVWLARAKAAPHPARVLRRAEELAEDALNNLGARPAPAPPIHAIERWWSPPVLRWLRGLAGEIERRRPSAARDLLTVAFLRTMIGLSAASFRHVSMSFQPTRDIDVADEGPSRFQAEMAYVLDGARRRPRARPRFAQGDARNLAPLGRRRFDWVITSPPYPNRISYVRELRPYMYWTRHLTDARQAGELDWRAIGGTWGVATSRLKDYARTHGRAPAALARILPKVRGAHPKNGPLLAAYLDRYFEDTEQHLRALRPRVARGGAIHYVVGNSTFYGELVPVEALYAELMERAGFKQPEIVTLRKRNSKKELYEFRVSART